MRAIAVVSVFVMLGMPAAAASCQVTAAALSVRTFSESTDVERAVAALARRYVDSSYHPPLTKGITLEAVVKSARDPNTRVLTAAQFAALTRETSGAPHVGIGLSELLRVDIDASGEHLLVVAPEMSSPAALAGLQPGDEIVMIDGRATAGVSLATAADWLRGPAGSSVVLTVRRSSRRFEIALVRRKLPGTGAMIVARLLRRPARTGYIRIAGFAAATADSAAAALSRLRDAGARKILIDLRGNPGGNLSVARQVAGLFMGVAPMGLSISRGNVDTVTSLGRLMSHEALAVLVDGGTASAAELLAAGLRDSHGALLVGERTFGKGLVHSIFGPFSDRSVMIFTVARLATLSGRDILTNGIEPDVQSRSHCSARDRSVRAVDPDLDPEVRCAATILDVRLHRE